MNIKSFVKRWSDHGYEKAETQQFWMTFLRDIFDLDKLEDFIQFELQVKVQHVNFIDAYLQDTKVIIEQKSSSINLDNADIYEQAKRYNDNLPYSMKARWIIVSNFKEFMIYDMETLDEPNKILLTELPERYHELEFLIDREKTRARIELELSLQAGEIVGKIYDALHAQYVDPKSSESLASLNKLCVRLVFCLYAESSGIFKHHKLFRDFLAEGKNIRWALLHLFEVLNTPINDCDPFLDDTLKKFPYVNGGLFAGSIEIPNFTPEIRELLL